MNNRLLDLSVIASCAVFAGCVAITRVHDPTELILQSSDEQVEIEPLPGRRTTVSIGDEVVRFAESALFPECCSRLLGREVPLNGWRNTFNHPDGKGYSNPLFFRGQIGVVLDENLNLLRWIQIRGLRRWRQEVMGGTPFFLMTRRYTYHWWLRYGGEDDGNYRFEIVERPGDSQSEVIQPVVVSEQEFLEGFFVRGTGVQGMRPDHRGIIDYRTLEDSQ